MAIIHGSPAVLIQKSGSGNSVIVLVEDGATVTATSSAATVTGVSSGGSVTLAIPQAGTYTISASKNGVTTPDVKVIEIPQSVSLSFVTADFDSNSWDLISATVAAGQAANYWSVGDTKAVALSGTVGTLALNATYYVYILGFNHNGATNTMDIGMFKTAKTSGIDVCLCDSTYGSYSSATTAFHMNTSDSNSGGWNKSAMRYYILGSTNMQNGNATSDCTINPVKNSLMAALPEDLRAVLKPMTIYSDNTGGGSNTASYVTTTVDYLPLLSEYEVQGTRSYANSAEQNHQAQYQYYKSGNSKIKYKHNGTSTAAYWWLRSVSAADSVRFCGVQTAGSAYRYYAHYCTGVAPCARI